MHQTENQHKHGVENKYGKCKKDTCISKYWIEIVTDKPMQEKQC